jgi:hypothetical protein
MTSVPRTEREKNRPRYQSIFHEDEEIDAPPIDMSIAFGPSGVKAGLQVREGYPGFVRVVADPVGKVSSNPVGKAPSNSVGEAPSSSALDPDEEHDVAEGSGWDKKRDWQDETSKRILAWEENRKAFQTGKREKTKELLAQMRSKIGMAEKVEDE